jgi:hypothetical protein
VIAHDRRRSEAALFRDSFDCEIGRFQQLLRAANSYARYAGRWSGSDLLTEAAAQRPGAHRGAASKYRQRQIIAKVPVDPCQEWRQRRVVVRRRFMNDELRLPTSAFERHHGGSRRLGGNLGAEVASHQMQTQIEARSGAR